MSSLENLKKTASLGELAILLGYKPKALSYILYKIPSENKYIEFTIPKKNGGERIIKAPVDQLKHLQSRLADILSICFDEICIRSKHKRSLSHGFRKKHTIITNAFNHINKRYVFNADLQDFFPSINFGRVRGFFIKNAHFDLDPKVATVIAQIACHDNELPQGSPCSPIISNLIGHLLDIRMVNLSKKAKCTYSRYADDLTFSTNRKEFPQEIGIRKNGTDDEWVSGKALKKEIGKVGFTINEKKTSLQYKTSRQIATGLVVNKKVNIKRDYYKQARSMCHALFQSDEFYMGSKHLPVPAILENVKPDEASSLSDSLEVREDGSSPEKNVKGSINQLEGILSHIYQVKAPHDDRKIGDKRYSPTAVMKLYRKFLFYKHFFLLDRPLIICEGKTDIVYLKCALRQLEKEYGRLVKKEANGFVFNIRFLNMTKNLKDVFAISEGASGLISLLGIYEKYMKPFKGHGKEHPVIMLFDDDSGSEAIHKKLKYDSAMPFSFYAENLYVAHIPPIRGAEETAIEDLFNKETLSTNVEGKTFNRKAKIDSKTEYGKIVFAEKVVKANQTTINFDGFKEILNRFERILDDYYQKGIISSGIPHV